MPLRAIHDDNKSKHAIAVFDKVFIATRLYIDGRKWLKFISQTNSIRNVKIINYLNFKLIFEILISYIYVIITFSCRL